MENSSIEGTRVDKWLWAVRLFKTRSLAAKACRDGQVLIDGHPVKPAREVRSGETITAKAAGVKRTVKILAAPASRIGAKLVPEFMEDLTPESEFEKAREAARPPKFSWSKGVGRPTKKSRRLWEQFGTENP